MTQAATTLESLRSPVPAPTVEVGFSSSDSYALIRNIAKDFAASDLVPKEFQGKAPNCMIALNMALRMRADPLMVMQNLYIVYNRPGWSASFLIACFNQCGRFSPIAYRFEGERDKDNWGCRAVSSYIADGTPIEGPLVTIQIAKAEGWYDKSGSKWKTMPEQMLRYRAASWMIRSTAPEIGMGFQTRDELIDSYDLERGKDGVFEMKLEDVKPEAQEITKTLPAEASAEPQAPKPNPRAEMEALREETRVLWESTGRTLDEAEQSIGLLLKQWTRQHCNKIQDMARNILSSQQSAQTASAENAPHEVSTIPCPNQDDALIDEMNCTNCASRSGCPSWG